MITTSDTGYGISNEDKKRIFDRFYRVDKARTRQKGGFGLGLSLAKQIIDACGGRIDVQDTTAVTASVTTISTIPNGRTMSLYPDVGLAGAPIVITFVHNTGVNQPHCAGGIDAIIDSTTEDWIEFTKQTRLNGAYRLFQTGGETY